jgi:hypothetical protein
LTGAYALIHGPFMTFRRHRLKVAEASLYRYLQVILEILNLRSSSPFGIRALNMQEILNFWRRA